MICKMIYHDKGLKVEINRKLKRIFGDYKINMIDMLNEITEKYPEASIEKIEKVDNTLYVYLGNRTEILLSELEKFEE